MSKGTDDANDEASICGRKRNRNDSVKFNNSRRPSLILFINITFHIRIQEYRHTFLIHRPNSIHSIRVILKPVWFFPKSNQPSSSSNIRNFSDI